MAGKYDRTGDRGLHRVGILMRKDYEILGIDENADEKTIKRAYFKLIRTYSPEKAPERFQEIRAAYERLIEEKKQPENGIVLEFPKDDVLAKNMFDNIQVLMHEMDYNKAAELAKQGMQHYNEIECFLYMFARCSILNNKSGNAVKAYEKLVKQFPDKIYYKMELAKAYLMRGYNRKAFDMFQTAYTEGCREILFLLEYATCCVDRREYITGQSVLMNLLDAIPPEKVNSYIPELIEAYDGLFSIFMYSRYPIEDVIDRCTAFLDKVGSRVQEPMELLLDLYAVTSIVSKVSGGQAINNLVTRLGEQVPYDVIKNTDMGWMKEQIETEQMLADERFSPLTKYTIQAYMEYDYKYYGEEQKDYETFLEMDATLWQIEEWPKQRKELELLKNLYPNVYEGMPKELWDILFTSSREQLIAIRNHVIIDYSRLERKFQNGRYFEMYPERRSNMEQVLWDSLESGTFVRENKKIGRNEPCPCGSGKKYKNCCGKGV